MFYSLSPLPLPQEILILASDKSASGKSTIWLGEVVESVGVFRFKQDSSSITSTVYPDSLQVSPVGAKSLVVAVSYDKRYLFVSRDFGRTWTRYETPTSNFDPVEELHLSNANPQHMVILSGGGQVSSLSPVAMATDDVHCLVSHTALR